MTRRMKRAKSLKKATALFLTMSLLLSTLSITALAAERTEWEKEQQAVEVILDLMDDPSSHLSNFLNGDNKELSSADAGSAAFAYTQAVTRQMPMPALAALVPPPII